jgi:hypothetical protein
MRDLDLDCIRNLKGGFEGLRNRMIGIEKVPDF